MWRTILRGLTAALLGLVLAGCQPLAVNTQHDPYAPLASYRTFDWVPEKPTKLPADQQLLSQQLKFTVEQALRDKGIARDATAPDFLIEYYGDSEEKTSSRLVEHANYWSDRDRYDHVRNRSDADKRLRAATPRTRVNYTRSVETQTITYTEGTLVIDFLDAASNEVVWQSTIQGVLSRSDPLKSITDGVRKALDQFPPPQ